MEELQKARVKRTLDHISGHDGNIKYVKYKGEIQYNGVKAPDSDASELLSTLTSKKKRRTRTYGERTANVRRTYGERTANVRRTYGERTANIQLSLNVAKTKFMVFHTPNKIVKYPKL